MLELKQINAYYGESHILRDVTFTVSDGEVVCLMGRNGVGKTTTLKVITGLLPTRSGDLVPHLTVRENLQLGFWARSDSPSAAVEKAAFDEVYHLFPKLTQILHRPGGVLSGGEQQQLAIGRALLSNPKLLLLDEPTEGIQPSIVDQVEDVILGFKKSRRFAILLVEQGLHFAARLAEKYIVMAKGAVVVAGKSDELSAEMVRQHLTV
jgi:urea transport system ATP-binding protein